MAGPSYSQVRQAGGLGTIAGEAPMEAFDRAVLNAQNRTKGYEDINTNRLAQIQTGQTIQENEILLKRMRDQELARLGEAPVNPGLVSPQFPKTPIPAQILNPDGATPAQRLNPNLPSNTQNIPYNLGQPAPEGPTVPPSLPPAGLTTYLPDGPFKREEFTIGEQATQALPLTFPPKTDTSETQDVTETTQVNAITPQVVARWNKLEVDNGFPKGFLKNLAQIESNFDVGVMNREGSGAGGAFQIMPETADDLELAREDRFDINKATDAIVRLTNGNRKALQRVLGRPPTAAELYLAHQQGARGASFLLLGAKRRELAFDVLKKVYASKKDPAKRARDVLDQNGFRGKNPSASEFANYWMNRFRRIETDPADIPVVTAAIETPVPVETAAPVETTDTAKERNIAKARESGPEFESFKQKALILYPNLTENGAASLFLVGGKGKDFILEQSVTPDSSDPAPSGTVVSEEVQSKRTSRVGDADAFGSRVRNVLGFVVDYAAGGTAAAGTAAYGVSADVSGAVAAILGFNGLSADLEKLSDVAYNVALHNLIEGYASGAGMTAEEFDMEPDEYRKLLFKAEQDHKEAIEKGVVEPSKPVEQAQIKQATELNFTGPTTGQKGGLTFGDKKPSTTPVIKPSPDSLAFIGNDLEIKQARNDLASQGQQLLSAYKFAQLTSDFPKMAEIQSQLNMMDTDRRYLDGMVMLSEFNKGNDQALADWLAYSFPGDNYALQPYTDGKYGIVDRDTGEPVDPRVDNLTREQMIADLRNIFDREYRQLNKASMATQAKLKAELFMKEFESQLATNKDLKVELLKGSIQQRVEKLKLVEGAKEYKWTTMQGSNGSMAIAQIPNSDSFLILQDTKVIGGNGEETIEPRITITSSGNPMANF